MKKDPLNEDVTLKNKGNNEELTISSTGYGLESVSKKDSQAENNRTNPSCGGL